MELDLQSIKNKTGPAFIISHMSIFFPFVLGIVLSIYLYIPFVNPQISFLAFALFMGIAMSITAFPVLARILQERQLTRTSFGSMALTCAAVDDVTAWCLLSFVITIVKAQSMQSGIMMIVLSIAYVLMMFRYVRPLLEKYWSAARYTGHATKEACQLGVLMNTRGLVELIILNIGFDLGILTGQVFAMMVLMALVTTFMTGPLLGVIDRVFAKS